MALKKISVIVLVGLLLSLFLSGCGFRLRQPLPAAELFSNIYISLPFNNYKTFTKDLKRYLQLSGSKITDSPAQACAVLKVTDVSRTKTLVSINSAQQTMQYNVALSISFSVLDKYGKNLLPEQTISENMPLTVGVNQILAGSNQIEYLYLAMERNIAYSVFLYLTTAKRPNIKQHTT